MEDLESKLKRLPLRRPSEQLDGRFLDALANVPVSGPGRARRRALVGAVVLLGIVLGGGFYLRRVTITARSAPAGRSVVKTDEEVLRVLERETMSARLAASARILSQQPECKRLARESYRYVAEAYSDTRAAKRARQFLEEE